MTASTASTASTMPPLNITSDRREVLSAVQGQIRISMETDPWFRQILGARAGERDLVALPGRAERRG
jgi:hypothetical protein